MLAAQVERLYRTTLNPEAISALSARLDRRLLELPEPAQSLMRTYLDSMSVAVREQVEVYVGSLAAASVTYGLSLVDTLGSVIGLVLLPLWMLGMMIGQRSAGPALRRALPAWAQRDVFALIRIVDRALGTFVRGQLALGIAVGATLYIGIALLEYYTAFDARYPGLIAVLAALLQLIPQFGPLIGLVLFGFLGLGVSPQAALVIVALYAGAQIFVSTFVAPHFQRRLTDLNPGMLLLLITALSPFGIFWMLLSAPLLAIARDLLRYAYGRIADPPDRPGSFRGSRFQKPIYDMATVPRRDLFDGSFPDAALPSASCRPVQRSDARKEIDMSDALPPLQPADGDAQLTQARVPLHDAALAFSVRDEYGRLPIVIVPERLISIQNPLLLLALVIVGASWFGAAVFESSWLLPLAIVVALVLIVLAVYRSFILRIPEGANGLLAQGGRYKQTIGPGTALCAAVRRRIASGDASRDPI